MVVQAIRCLAVYVLQHTAMAEDHKHSRTSSEQ